MEEKKIAAVTVSVECSDGFKQTVSGDTAIVFTVSEIEKFMKGEISAMDGAAAYIGNGIPDPIFARALAEYIICLAETEHKNPVKAAFFLHAMSERLTDASKRLCEGSTDEHMSSFLKESVSDMVDRFFGKG